MNSIWAMGQHDQAEGNARAPPRQPDVVAPQKDIISVEEDGDHQSRWCRQYAAGVPASRSVSKSCRQAR